MQTSKVTAQNSVSQMSMIVRAGNPRTWELRQDDCPEFEASLGNMVSSRPDWGTEGNLVSQQHEQKDKSLFLFLNPFFKESLN